MSQVFEHEPIRTKFLNKKVFRTWIKFVAKKTGYYDRIIDSMYSEPASDIELQREWNKYADDNYALYLEYTWHNGEDPRDFDWLVEYMSTSIYEDFDGYKDSMCGWVGADGRP